jgi:hypothetical protein
VKRYYVAEFKTNRECDHCFSVTMPGEQPAVGFRVSDYGLDEARRRAEAECKWLNEKAEQWYVDERDDVRESDHRFRVLHKHKPIHSDGLATIFFVKPVGLDLARAEAERLCKILNERDAK